MSENMKLGLSLSLTSVAYLLVDAYQTRGARSAVIESLLLAAVLAGGFLFGAEWSDEPDDRSGGDA